MHAPVLKDPAHLLAEVDAGERLFAELGVIRRRLERVAVALSDFRRNTDAPPEWSEVSDAADVALRAVQGAMQVVPALPFEERVAISENELAVDDLTISIAERRAWYVSREVRLSATEFAFLVALARRPERVFTKAELLRDVWGYRSIPRSRSVDTTAGRVRRKLVAAGTPPGRYVVCVWGVGYSLMRP